MKGIPSFVFLFDILSNRTPTMISALYPLHGMAATEWKTNATHTELYKLTRP